MKTIISRMHRKTPKFFKKVRTVGLTVAAIGAAIVAAPVKLPFILLKVAEYLTVAGGVMTGVSQTAVKDERK